MKIRSCLVLLGATYGANFQETLGYEEGMLRGDCQNVKGPQECLEICRNNRAALAPMQANKCGAVPGPLTAWQIGEPWSKGQEHDWMHLNVKDVPKGCDLATSKCRAVEDCQSWCKNTEDCAWFSWFIRGTDHELHRCQGKTEKQIADGLKVGSNSTSCANVALRCTASTHCKSLWHAGTYNFCVWRSVDIVGGTLEHEQSLMHKFEAVNNIVRDPKYAAPFDPHLPLPPSEPIINPTGKPTDKPTEPTVPKVQTPRPEPPTEKPTAPTDKPTDEPTRPEIPPKRPEPPTEKPTAPTDKPTDEPIEPTRPEIPPNRPEPPTEKPTAPTDKPTEEPIEPEIPPYRPEPPTEKPTVPTDNSTVHTDKPTDKPSEPTQPSAQPEPPTMPTGISTDTEAKPQINDTPTTKTSGSSTATKVGAIVGAAGGVAVIGAGSYAAFRALRSGAPSTGQTHYAATNERPNMSGETATELEEPSNEIVLEMEESHFL